MKLTKLAFLIAASISTVTLTACGDSNSTTPYPDPAPAPAPETIEFPVQSDTPTSYSLDVTGSILTSENGLSLYYFAKDIKGTSNCNGVEGDAAGSTTDKDSCAGKWPPLLTGDGAVQTSDFTFVERADGTQQWAFKGYPLYNFAGDKSQADIYGEGVGGVWDLARPNPLKVAALNDIETYMGNQTILSGALTGQTLDKFRADKDGFTLYIYDNDALNNSACNNEKCISTWPPLLADNAAKPEGMLSLIKRVEGDNQWSYKGKPLYFFKGDNAPAETNGDNVLNVWHIANELPAIQRTSDAGTMLTATGLVSALLPNENNAGALEATMVDKDQFTLYTFDNDEANKSNCIDACAVTWPPFLASDTEQDMGQFTKFAREDGAMQWAFNQQPLYFFINDTAKNQTTGDGVKGVWHIIEPAPVVTPVTTSLVYGDSVLGKSLVTEGEVLILADDGAGGFAPTTVDKSGFQLYTFDNDTAEQSNCSNAVCMGNWPALLASDTDTASAPFSIFTRADGHKQWAVNSMPLYFFTNDTAAGEQLGENIGNVWYVARPAPVRAFTLATKGVALIAHGNILASQGKTSAQLTDLTLYTFDNDVANSGLSTCIGSCAVTWPPLYATSSDEALGDYEIISRTESDNSETLQWAYKGLPLYFFTADTNIGDTAGDYTSWTIARP
jgi:predicted lipoprotein with Yx(FWY)xxD motif